MSPKQVFPRGRGRGEFGSSPVPTGTHHPRPAALGRFARGRVTRRLAAAAQAARIALLGAAALWGLVACDAAEPVVDREAPPAAMVVALDGALGEWWNAGTGELALGSFEFESAVLGGGPATHLTWPAWAPSAALAGFWAGRSPRELGRTDSSDAGSLRPRWVAPTVAEQFAAHGWRTWIVPGSDDLALWPPHWLGFDGGLAPGARTSEDWPGLLADERRAASSGLLVAVVLPTAELELVDADRAAAWEAWARSGGSHVGLFEAGELSGLARGDADVWRAVRERTARRRGQPEALAFEALEQGARLMAADRWLVTLEAAFEASDAELWVTLVGTVEEGRGVPRVPLFVRAGAGDSPPWPSEWSPGDVPGLARELGARSGIALRVSPPEAEARLWGADPNRPYRRSGSEWRERSDPFAAEPPTEPPVLSAGWRLTWPEQVPPGELRVKLQVAEGDALQGWWMAERDGTWRASRASKSDRAEWRFPSEDAPRWLEIALERRGAPVLFEVSLDGRPIPEPHFLFQGDPLGRSPLPRLVDPSARPNADSDTANVDTANVARLLSKPAGTELNLGVLDQLFGARRWPPGVLTSRQPIDPEGPIFLDWRAPGRPALAISSGEAFRPASELLFDQRPNRGERTSWVLWPVEPLAADRTRSAPPTGTAPRRDHLSSRDDLNTRVAEDSPPPDPNPPFAPDPLRWDLRPLGAPFASDAGLWSRQVTPEIWEQRQRELRRAPGR